MDESGNPLLVPRIPFFMAFQQYFVEMKHVCTIGNGHEWTTEQGQRVITFDFIPTNCPALHPKSYEAVSLEGVWFEKDGKPTYKGACQIPYLHLINSVCI